MSEATDFAKLRRVPPAEAVAYMQGRETATVTYNAAALWQDEHSRQFTISRLARADLVQAMQESIAKAVAGDMTRRDWIKSSEQLLKSAGWWGTKAVTDASTGEILKTTFDHNRLQLIFDTNVRMAQAAGQWQRMLRNQRTHPFARYVTVDDARVRPQHRAWANVTLPLSHPWWSMHRPPNGYRCRCRVVGVTQAEYDAGTVSSRPNAGLMADARVVTQPMVKQAPPVNLVAWDNPVTGQTQLVPDGVDPGFDYNAGTVGNSQAFEMLVQAKLARLSPEVAAAARAARLTTGLPSEAFTGQRPGLADLPPLQVPRVGSADLAGVQSQATRVLQALARRDGLVNADTGWLIGARPAAAAAAGPDAAADVLMGLRALVRQAVVTERQIDGAGAVWRLAGALRIGGQVHRVAITVRAAVAGNGAQGYTLEAVALDGTPLAAASDGPLDLVSVAELLRGAVRSDGRPFALGG